LFILDQDFWYNFKLSMIVTVNILMMVASVGQSERVKLRGWDEPGTYGTTFVPIWDVDE
jgi:hypothetical protein